MWGSTNLLYLFMKYHRVSNKSTSNTADAISGAGTVYTSGAPEFTPVFSGVRVAQSLIFCVVFFRLMLFLLSFFFWTLYCPFFDLRLLVVHLLSLNFSFNNQWMHLVYIRTFVCKIHNDRLILETKKNADFSLFHLLKNLNIADHNTGRRALKINQHPFTLQPLHYLVMCIFLLVICKRTFKYKFYRSSLVGYGTWRTAKYVKQFGFRLIV